MVRKKRIKKRNARKAKRGKRRGRIKIIFYRLLKILVVDYEAPTVKELQDFFQERGHITFGTQHPEYLGDILSNNPFDLIVMGVSFPTPEHAGEEEKEEMEYGRTAGLYLLKKLKAEFPDLEIPPVIILSVVQKRIMHLDDAYSDLEIACVLQKPCYSEDLERAVGLALL